jgi:hypothetical protein
MISSNPNINKVLRYIVPKSGIRFDGRELRRLDGPCVYIFVKDDLALYVGMSSRGLQRSIGKGHSVAEKCKQECDELLVYYCHSIEAASECEGILIKLFSPKYNMRKTLTHFKDSTRANLGLSVARARVVQSYANDDSV